ncbi:hypothetical protein [Aureimonas sp. ME7]|uniref:hypothetical protein n=1 Tax=Aureimonas sp. ME7 TaxID=2744252 RepID=UPI0015FD50F4|nr:hypothetical protein [Aureimonas sp. ME7]
MADPHPIFGDLAVRDRRFPNGRWVVRNSNVPLDEVLHLIDTDWDLVDILKRHVMLLRSDLVEITMLHHLKPL